VGRPQRRTIHVHASKTERARTIKLLQPLAQDLAEWRMASGRPPDSALIFPTHDGDEWQLHDRQNWRRRIYQPAARQAGVTGDLCVYRLRGSFVSLLLWEGHSLTYVAEQAGHRVATLAKHYAGTLEELEDKPRTPAAEAINAARTELKCAQSVRSDQIKGEGGPTESPVTTRVLGCLSSMGPTVRISNRVPASAGAPDEFHQPGVGERPAVSLYQYERRRDVPDSQGSGDACALRAQDGPARDRRRQAEGVSAGGPAAGP
jgi:hypothetical protein